VLTNKDMQLFESVARNHPRLREWLVTELASKHEVLVKMADMEQLRRTQGYAQCLQTLIENLDAATKSPRGNAGSAT